MVEVASKEAPDKVILDNFDSRFDDGRWHKVILFVGENKMELVVNDIPMKTQKLISVKTGKEFLIGGKYIKVITFDLLTRRK